MKEYELQNELKWAFQEYWFNKDKDFISIVQIDLDKIIDLCNEIKNIKRDENEKI